METVLLFVLGIVVILVGLALSIGLHELGHLVGLAHVSSPGEVMTDRGNGTARRLGPGDRIGLHAVGQPL